MDRSDIYIISRNSNWSQHGIENKLETEIYNDANAWKKFLRSLMMLFSIGFTAAGIIFFFAFNWNSLHRLIKLGLVELVLILVIVITIFTKNSLVKHLLLLVASLLVGALMAVFGQIYQTSATQFDFFLGWTCFIAIWVMVTNFSFLWILFLYLANMLVVFYFNIVLFNTDEFYIFLSLMGLNSAWLILFQSLSKKYNYFKMPIWLVNIVFIVIVSISTLGVMVGILERFNLAAMYVMIVATIIAVVGLMYAFAKRNLVFLAVVLFGLVLVIASLISNRLLAEWRFLVVGLFVTISVGYLISFLLKTQKKWKDA